MTPEGRVKSFIDKRMKEWFPDAIKYSPPGVGRFGRNGFPDRIWWIKANDTTCVTVAIEAKADFNCEPTELQKQALKRFKDIGAVAAVVKGLDGDKMAQIRLEIIRRIAEIDR